MKCCASIQGCAGDALTLMVDRRPDAQAASTDAPEEAFQHPPTSAHVDSLWHWMNGNITK